MNARQEDFGEYLRRGLRQGSRMRKLTVERPMPRQSPEAEAVNALIRGGGKAGGHGRSETAREEGRE